MKRRSSALLQRTFSSKPPGEGNRSPFSIPVRRSEGSEDNFQKHSKSSYNPHLNKHAPFPIRHNSVASYINEFQNKSFVLKDSIKALGLSGGLIKSALTSFRNHAIAGEIETLSIKSLEEAGDNHPRAITLEFLKHIIKIAPSHQTLSLIAMMATIDMRDPVALYSSNNNKMNRKIIFHAGPTNSGKTYHALNSLEKAQSGVYCGPLRLLAHEIYERFNNDGIPCNLVTGEDVRSDDAILKYACTIEMVPLAQSFDVAVIDEIQMIADGQRGWAWTKALLSVKAKEVHICGEPTAIDLVKRLCKELGEEVEVREYTRLTPLSVEAQSLGGDEGKIVKGDCFVAFSRSEIFQQKKLIEKKTGLRAAVIYGSLPPESRASQAKLFNDQDSEYDILIASNAIGMGLNLNIKRVVFSTTRKFNGVFVAPLATTEIKQIGGRAGRFKSAHPQGYVTTLFPKDLGLVKSCMNSGFQPLTKAGLSPSFEMLEALQNTLPDETLEELLIKFEGLAQTNENFFICDTKDSKSVAALIEDLDLSLEEKFIIAGSPASVANTFAEKCTYQFSKALSLKTVCRINQHVDIPVHIDKGAHQLKLLEARHKVVLLYLWLSYRFSDIYTDVASATQLKNQLEVLIQEGLARIRDDSDKKKDGPRTPNKQVGRDRFATKSTIEY